MDHNGSRASEKVSAIGELLEAILLQIPVKDLLLNQRVCKQWHSTIKNSTRLQQALFFKPLTARPLLKNPQPSGIAFYAGAPYLKMTPPRWTEDAKPRRSFKVFESPFWHTIQRKIRLRVLAGGKYNLQVFTPSRGNLAANACYTASYRVQYM